MAPTTTHATMIGGVATPLAQVAHSAKAHAHHHDLRPRSAPCGASSGRPAIPPAGRRPWTGRTCRTRRRRPSTVEWVSWSSTYGTVMVCIHVPVFESRRGARRTARSPGSGTAASAPPVCRSSARWSPAAGLPRRRIYGVGHAERVFVYADRMVPLQRSLLGAGDPAIDAAAPWERIDLDERSLGRRRPELRCAAPTTSLDHVVARVPWHVRPAPDVGPHGRRPAPVVPLPRRRHAPPPGAGRGPRRAHAPATAWRFGPLGLNYYRDGRDSVASTATASSASVDDTLIAIVTLGARRPFLLRPLTRSGAPVASTSRPAPATCW